MKRVIQRSKWLRGGYDPITGHSVITSLLLAPSGAMCCLGFDDIQSGVEADDIRDIESPNGISHHVQAANSYRDRYCALGVDDYNPHTPDAYLAMEINDLASGEYVHNTSMRLLLPEGETRMTEPNREAMLTALFKRAWDIDLEFVD